MQLTTLQLKNFRCFSEFDLTVKKPILLFEGENGSGKTAILEALHYACYLKSFRTHIPKNLIRFKGDGFFVKVCFTAEREASLDHEVQVGFSGTKRLVKVDQKPVASFKDLMDHYRVITLTEDNLELIKGSPGIRRAFIDQFIMLHDAQFLNTIRSFRQILEQRNSLLQQQMASKESYEIWTEQLWKSSTNIQQKRRDILKRLCTKTNELLREQFTEDQSVKFEYRAKKIISDQSFTQFVDNNQRLREEEQRYGRSLFGAHLDDFNVSFHGYGARDFSSRGQQKLIVLLIKVAQIREIASRRGPALFLLDDFMTDFDEKKIETLLKLLDKLNSQLIFTMPTADTPLKSILTDLGCQREILTH